MATYSLRDIVLDLAPRFNQSNTGGHHQVIALGPTRALIFSGTTWWAVKHTATSIELLNTGTWDSWTGGFQVRDNIFAVYSGADGGPTATYWMDFETGAITHIQTVTTTTGLSGYRAFLQTPRDLVLTHHSNFVSQRGGGYTGTVQTYTTFRVFNDGTMYQINQQSWNVNTAAYYPNNYEAKGFGLYGPPIALDEETTAVVGTAYGIRDNWVGIYHHVGRCMFFKYNKYTGAFTLLEPDPNVQYDWIIVMSGFYSGGWGGGGQSRYWHAASETFRFWTSWFSHDNNQGSDRTPTRTIYYDEATDTWDHGGGSQNYYRLVSGGTTAVWGGATTSATGLGKTGRLAQISHDDDSGLDNKIGPTFINIFEPEYSTVTPRQTLYVPEETYSDSQNTGLYVDVVSADDDGGWAWVTWGENDGRQYVGILKEEKALLPGDGAAAPLRLVQRDDGGRTGPRIRPGSVQAQTTSAQASERIVGPNTYDGRGAGGGSTGGDPTGASDPELLIYLGDPDDATCEVANTWGDGYTIVPDSEVWGWFRKTSATTYETYVEMDEQIITQNLYAENCAFLGGASSGGPVGLAYDSTNGWPKYILVETFSNRRVVLQVNSSGYKL